MKPNHPFSYLTRVWTLMARALMVGLLALVLTSAALAGQDRDDPIVRISLLPGDFDEAEVLAKISRDFSEDTGIDQSLTTFLWQPLSEINCQGRSSRMFRTEQFPAIVELFINTTFNDEMIAHMMTSLADSLEKTTGIGKEWIFIQTHIAQPGHVFVNGKVMTWESETKTGEKSKPKTSNDGKIQPKQHKIVFDGESFDFELRRTLGYTLAGGADINECLETAWAITDGDAESWYTHWYALGERIRKTGERVLAAGHKVSAREAFLRAVNYYRMAEFYLHGNPKDPRIVDSWKKSQDCFRLAAKLMDHPVEIVKIPYENTTLPGYFLRPDNSKTPKKTLIVMTGFDGTGEELYFSNALFALRRGYNVLIFEGPGQGGALRGQGLYFRPDYEKVITPVVDYALSRPDVDPKRLALKGDSMGGYLAPRGAAFEHRLAALVANPGVFDMYGNHNLSAEQWAEMEKYPKESEEYIQKEMAKDVGYRWWIHNGMFVSGTKSPLEFMFNWRAYTMGDLAGKIQCPTLVIMSDGDHFFTAEAQKKLYNVLTCPKTLMEFTGAELASQHCQMGAVAVSAQRVLDWLDETLAQVK